MNRLVILAPNWVGDAVMAQPAMADLRRAFPEATITVAARSSVAPLVRMMPDVSDAVPVDALAGGGFDTALLLPNSFRSALRAYRAGIPERWGFRTDWRGPLLTRAVPPIDGLHQVDAYRRLVAALGCANGSDEPRLVVSDALREAGAQQLREAGWNGHAPLVALAPGAAYGPAKRWPSASFAELAGDLARDGIQSVLVGGPDDAEVGSEIVAAAAQGGALLNLIAKNDVAGMAGVFASCRALVSNDSGAMHIGAAVGLPVTAAFGPTDERLTAPRGDRHTVLTHSVWCRPCNLRHCPLDHRCLRGISVATVAASARSML